MTMAAVAVVMSIDPPAGEATHLGMVIKNASLNSIRTAARDLQKDFNRHYPQSLCKFAAVIRPGDTIRWAAARRARIMFMPPEQDQDIFERAMGWRPETPATGLVRRK